MNSEILSKLDFSRGEQEVYEVLLNSGRLPVSVIQEKTGIERRNIYDILSKLIDKGLVAYVTENKKRYFRITHPNKILGFIEDQESVLQEKKELVNEEMPELLELYNTSRSDIQAEIFRGKEGVKAVWEEMLNYNKNYFIGGGWYVIDEMPHYWRSYNRRRKEHGVHWYNLARYDVRKRKPPERKGISVRYLPKEFSGSPNVIFVYGNKVANVLWQGGFFAFVIENKEIADNYRRYHQYLWNKVAIR